LNPSLKRFSIDQWLFPASLAGVLLLAVCWPGGESFAGRLHVLPIDHALIFLIFLISGLLIDVSRALDERPPWIPLGLVFGSQFVLAPLTGFLMSRLLPLPSSWAVGLALICCVPTTLSSGVVLTRQAEGNDLLAIILTLSLTLVGVLISPLLLGLLIGTSFSESFEVSTVVLRLFALVVVPLVIGQLLRMKFFPKPAASLRHICSACIALMVWITAQSHSSELRDLGWTAWLGFPLLALFCHGLWFSAVWVTGTRLKLHYRNQIACAIVGSQKTLPLAVALLTLTAGSGLDAEFYSAAIGFIVLFHLVQILADSVIGPTLNSIHMTSSYGQLDS